MRRSGMNSAWGVSEVINMVEHRFMEKVEWSKEDHGYRAWVSIMRGGKPFFACVVVHSLEDAECSLTNLRKSVCEAAFRAVPR